MKELINRVIASYSSYFHLGFPSKYVSFEHFNKELEAYSDLTDFQIHEIGRSIENRPIRSVTIGSGDIKVFIWTQMHGNEATATRAVFDFFNALLAEDNGELKRALLSELQIKIVPMLNPDGAERYQRRNALDVDPNRDAAARSTPEIKALFQLIEDFQPDWCFNMHDQRNLFNVSGTGKPATVSFLSPSTDNAETITVPQKEAMQLIDVVESELTSNSGVGVARFSNEFYPTATGDNIQKLGYRTVLVESGGHLDDPNRLVSREVVFKTLLFSLWSIATSKWKNGKESNYLKIPRNDTKLFDVLIRKVKLYNFDIEVDIGVNYKESINNKNQIVAHAEIIDIGDLSYYFGYTSVNAKDGQIDRSIQLLEEASFKIIFQDGKPTISLNNGCIE